MGLFRRWLFRVARSPLSGIFIAWIFAHMSWSIPVKRLHETPTLMAFHHPVPTHVVHILIVPRRNYRTLMHLRTDDAEFFNDLFATVQHLVRTLELEEAGFSLVANGGAYQDVPVVHFHLISGGPR